MIVGHREQKRKLQVLSKRGKLPHAFLFSGPDKIGKKKTAQWFLKELNCESEKEGPCDTCRSCQEIEEMTHTDITCITPEKKEIRMEKIEEVLGKVSYRGVKARSKGVIIDDAHLMNIYSQNAILKLLEEPPGETVLFLVTCYPYMLLPTVKSRLFEMRFSLVSEKEIEERVGDREIAFLSRGRPGIALDYLQYSEKRKEAEGIRKEVGEVLIKKDMAVRFRKAKEIVKKEKTEDFLECLLRTLQEKMRKEIREGRSSKKTREALKETQEILLFQAKTNINPQLALEKIMLKI